MELKEAITITIAAYGAVLSTFNLVQARRRDRRQLKVSMSTAVYTYGSDVGPAMVSIEVVNIGHRPVVVGAPTLRLPDKKTIALVGADGIRDFPKELGDGASAIIRSPYRDIAQALASGGYPSPVTITPICQLSTGQTFAGPSWTVDIAEWLRM